MRPAALILLGFVLVPAASAATIQADLEVSGDVTFQGTAQAAARWTGSIQDARLGPVEPFRLAVAGEAVLLSYRYAVVERDAGNPSGHGHDEVLLERRAQPLGRVDGTLASVEHDGHASLRLVPQATDVPVVGDFTIGMPRDLAAELRASDPQPAEERSGSYPAAGGQLRTPASELSSFEGRVLVSGWLVETAAGAIDTRWSTAGPAAPDLGGAFVQERHLLEVGLGEVRVLEVSGGWVTLASALAGVVDGDLLLHNAQGTGTLNGSVLPPGLRMLQAVGPMAISADYTQATARWAVEGEPVFVAVNAATVWGQRGSWIVTAAAAVGLAAALASLAGKGFLDLLSGVNIAEPLGNERRVRLLSLIAREPGLAQSALASRAAIPRPVVRHHLRILLRAKLVAERPIGNRKTYTLNDGTFEFGLPATAGPGRSRIPAAPAFAHFQQPVRSAILQALMTLGPCTGQAMRGHWASQGITISGSLASHHLLKLHRLGLLQRQGVGGDAVWSLAFDPAAALRHQRSAFLAIGGFKPIADALRAGPLTFDALCRRLRGVGPAKPRSTLAGQLRTMEAVGIVGRGPGDVVRLVE